METNEVELSHRGLARAAFISISWCAPPHPDLGLRLLRWKGFSGEMETDEMEGKVLWD